MPDNCIDMIAIPDLFNKKFFYQWNQESEK